ncbi:alpha-L-rhamnosidase N-terminal domain-containing protein [Streptomyces pseudogriseolus]|uniref:alpha-L-rhamnosidase N-terminal domain-containing protein n=1 Tax=Streptomyces pseudogriseolus TaxID=36817 RepID=UPI003FA3323F
MDLPGAVTSATLVITADNACSVSVNGREVARTDLAGGDMGWRKPAVVDVLGEVRAGRNVVAAEAVNVSEGPAGLLAVLVVGADAGERRIVTDAGWKTAGQEPAGDWRGADFDDAGWAAARAGGAWGEVRSVSYAVTQLWREFCLRRGRVRWARLYVTALGLYEAHLNGVRVGRDQFAPGWTDYRTRVQYQVHDVMELVWSGGNALGVFLAPGWYAGNVGVFGPHQYGERPALLVQLEVGYGGGSAQRVVSDTGWSVSGAGPVVGADLLDGESYDARRERPGWALPGFEDAGWLLAVQAEGVVSGRVVARSGWCAGAGGAGS